MGDSRFSVDVPQSGSRVEIVSGTQPRPYVVKVWINGKLDTEQSFATESEAKQYQSSANHKITDAERT